MSNNDTIITVDNLSKAYQLGKQERNDTFFATMANMVKAPLRNLQRLHRLNTFNLKEAEAVDTDDILWALKDVSFEVKRGECLGIIGRNGAGKSTLLKILSRIAEPTRGRIVMKGRVSALLEVGTGFHPELTGRENVYLNGTILGMKKAEISKKFDEIVDFSGVEKFLDTPVKRYSSGMRVRLAFAVAAHLEPEILIVDEVLAVGDIEFQKKCLGKMQDVASGEGRTVLFVSHNMNAVRALCMKGILIENGLLINSAEVNKVISDYVANSRQILITDIATRPGNGRVRVKNAQMLDYNNNIINELKFGSPFQLKIEFSVEESGAPLTIGVNIFSDDGTRIINTQNRDCELIIRPESNHFSVLLDFPINPLPPGSYHIEIGIIAESLIDKCECAYLFKVVELTDTYKLLNSDRPKSSVILNSIKWTLHNDE